MARSACSRAVTRPGLMRILCSTRPALELGEGPLFFAGTRRRARAVLSGFSQPLRGCLGGQAGAASGGHHGAVQQQAPRFPEAARASARHGGRRGEGIDALIDVAVAAGGLTSTWPHGARARPRYRPRHPFGRRSCSFVGNDEIRSVACREFSWSATRFISHLCCSGMGVKIFLALHKWQALRNF